MAFTHLHVHTDYSPKGSIAQIPDVVRKVADDGQTALAISDHGSLGGMWHLREATGDIPVKPIPALEAYLALDHVKSSEGGEAIIGADGQPVRTGRFDHAVESTTQTSTSSTGAGKAGGGMQEKHHHHLTVLGRNSAGWASLISLHNKSWEAHWGTPRIDYELLHEHRDGLIILTGCLEGPLQAPLQEAVTAQRELDRIDARDDLTDRAREHLRSGQQRLIDDRRAEAERALVRLIDAVGRENVFIEVMHHGIDVELDILEELYGLAYQYDLRCVATCDSHCLQADDEDAQDAWMAISADKKLDDSERSGLPGHGYWVKTEAEMRGMFTDDPRWQEACDNTQIVADMVDEDVIPAPQQRLPTFPTPPGFNNSSAYFEHLVWKGAHDRWGPTLPQPHIDRLTHEIQVIEDKGYADYFLLASDLIAWCHSDYTIQDWITLQAGRRIDDATRDRKTPVMTGPGRGSAAGAAISYCLGLTDVDPIANGLLFERFLAPDSTAMPDYDGDFEQRRRAEVLEFLRTRWGRNHVAQIGTYSMNRSRAALLTVGRAHGARHLGERLSSLVPEKGNIAYPFSAFLPADSEHGTAFRAAVDTDQARSILDLATQIEGVKANESTHASAVLISSEDLRNLVPLRKAGAADGQGIRPWVARWEGPEIEQFGMLKLDVLGLENLDILHRALDLLRDDDTHIDLNSIDANDLDDEKVAATWAMLAEGRTAGVFQLDGAGMTRLLTTAHPTSLEDLSTVIALYRPGPMSENMHTTWARIKAGELEKSYDQFTSHPEEQHLLASVLDETEGVIVLQEQLMLLAEKIAGFGPYAKSRLRKAVSKKKQTDLDMLEPLFKHGGDYTMPDGAIEKIPGGDAQFLQSDGTQSPAFAESTLDTLWATFRASGDYLFNKAHSYAYGRLAFWTAYLKANWLLPYAAATLTIAEKDQNRAPMLAELAQRGVDVQPPDVNRADISTRVVDQQIVYGLGEVKGVSELTARRIVAERSSGGEFTSFEDLTRRLVSTRSVKRPGEKAGGVSMGEVAHIVEAGGLDQFGGRKAVTQVIRGVLRSTSDGHQAPLLQPAPASEWSPLERAARQQYRLQASLGAHPTAHPDVRGLLGRLGGGRFAGISAVPQLEGAPNAQIVGVLTSWVQRQTKHGDEFVFGVLEDGTGTIDFVAWPESLRTILAAGRTPAPGELVVANGTVSPRTRRDKDTGEVINSGDLQVVASDMRVVDVPGQSGPPVPANAPFTAVMQGADRLLLEDRPKDMPRDCSNRSEGIESAQRLVRTVTEDPGDAPGGERELVTAGAPAAPVEQPNRATAPAVAPTRAPSAPRVTPETSPGAASSRVEPLVTDEDGVVHLSDADVAERVMATLMPGKSTIMALVDHVQLPLSGQGVTTPMRAGRPRFEVQVSEDAWRPMLVRGVPVRGAYVVDASGRDGIVLSLEMTGKGAQTASTRGVIDRLSTFVLKVSSGGRTG